MTKKKVKPISVLKKEYKEGICKIYLAEYNYSKPTFYSLVSIAFLIGYVAIPLLVWWVGATYGLFAVIQYVVVPFFIIKFIKSCALLGKIMKYIKDNK